MRFFLNNSTKDFGVFQFFIPVFLYYMKFLFLHPSLQRCNFVQLITRCTKFSIRPQKMLWFVENLLQSFLPHICFQRAQSEVACMLSCSLADIIMRVKLNYHIWSKVTVSVEIIFGYNQKVILHTAGKL